MKKILLSATLLITLALQGQAQNTTKKENIKNLFAIMHQDSLMIKTLDGITTSMVKNMSVIFSDTAYTNHGVNAATVMDKLTERSMKKSMENAMRLLNEDMVDIYDKYFTAAEIEDFTTFYKSKSGQKMLNQMPDITKDVMAIMSTKYMKELQESFRKDIAEITAELAKQTKPQEQ